MRQKPLDLIGILHSGNNRARAAAGTFQDVPAKCPAKRETPCKSCDFILFHAGLLAPSLGHGARRNHEHVQVRVRGKTAMIAFAWTLRQRNLRLGA